ncbi:hypothetical protein [Demequina sp. SO4-18]|uniref:hypothetical protein n=1 Tax=Demequina sp. SO4-18 TaxID=3401026 RepID=UPI003B5B1D8F
MSRRPLHPYVVGAAVSLASIILAACSPTDAPAVHDSPPPPPSPSLEREPGPGIDPAEFTTDGLRLPLQWDGAEFVDPGWEVTPQHLEGVFLVPVEADGRLVFTAIDSEGQALWTAERPLACAGFTLTLGRDGTPLAVLNDSTPTDGAIAQTTATAYDLRTGDTAWGPVDVPGPHQGPGLVYASPPAEAMGGTGPRVALDSATGDVAAAETDGGPRVVAERHGTVVTQEGTVLRATDSAGAMVWEAEAPAGAGEAHAVPGMVLGGPFLALDSGDDRAAVIDLADGSTVAPDVTSAAYDGATATLVATDGRRAWALDTSSGETLWEVSASAEARAVAAGGAQVYLRQGETIHVHNALTGAANPGYEASQEGTIMVPRVIAGTGAAAFSHEGRVFLATTPTGR